MPQTTLQEVDTKNKKRRVMKNALNELNGTEWIKNTASVWYQKGLGKNHPDTKYEKEHPAPFAYIMVERLLSFFTKKGDLVLDPFSGVGSTLKACELNNRNGVGIELIKKWADLTKERLNAEAKGGNSQVIIQGDSRIALKKFNENNFDFIVTSPPYWGILNKKADHRVREERISNNLATNYSDSLDDIGNIESYDAFLVELGKIFSECYRVLKPKKFIAVVVNDFRHGSRYIPYHSDVSALLSEIGFIQKGMIIFVKNAKKLYPYGYPYDYVPNVMHEYILIFKKVDTIEDSRHKTIKRRK